MSDDEITGTISFGQSNENPSLAGTVTVSGDAANILRQAAKTPTQVSLTPSATQITEDQALWAAIRNRTEAISFNRYNAFIHKVLCIQPETHQGHPPDDPSSPSYQGTDVEHLRESSSHTRRKLNRRIAELKSRNSIYGMDSYKLLDYATEAFLVLQCGLVLDEELFDEDEESRRMGRPVDFTTLSQELADYLGAESNSRTLPYFKRILEQIFGARGDRMQERLPFCESLLRNRVSCPTLIELIWSYWHEMGFLVQTMNAISLRFQNRRVGDRDPLENLELAPLLGITNLLWGYIQCENDRLSLQRRCYEYAKEYGFTLIGKAVPELHPADFRSEFIEAFHNLLHRAVKFYELEDDTTIRADAFPLLNAIREVHLILAHGAHNQFAELALASRKEFLMMQWLLASPQIKEFLHGRPMVPYQEAWQQPVDQLKKMKGWCPDISVTYFHELAKTGEEILLALRLGDWAELNDQEHARNFARHFRPEIQRYVHAYNAVTGVDLTTDIVDTRQAVERYQQPSVQLSKHARRRNGHGADPARIAPATAALLSEDVAHYAELSPMQRTRLLRRIDGE